VKRKSDPLPIQMESLEARTFISSAPVASLFLSLGRRRGKWVSGSSCTGTGPCRRRNSRPRRQLRTCSSGCIATRCESREPCWTALLGGSGDWRSPLTRWGQPGRPQTPSESREIVKEVFVRRRRRLRCLCSISFGVCCSSRIHPLLFLLVPLLHPTRLPCCVSA